ncbi:hypothetical protein [Nocardia mexicana]|uniref:Uncharacterized protein n=1 Tax=Nocardia mexicana TaxID=279262 RepID=A0A370HJ35_9NOCA|nr:hypothetical protein [Nocardia mexicana]RDI55489.1 hypothetical protein DFR68_101322 [Nocardia mexicana]
MKWSKWDRQLHRWLSIIFTTTVLVAIVAAALGMTESAAWVFYVPLLPLLLLMVTGLYMFVLPYRVKRNSARPGPYTGIDQV